MNHFKQQDWVDFVRGTLEPGRAANIEAHLADGCQRCRATVSGWQAIVSLASRVRKTGAAGGCSQQGQGSILPGAGAAPSGGYGPVRHFVI